MTDVRMFVDDVVFVMYMECSKVLIPYFLLYRFSAQLGFFSNSLHDFTVSDLAMPIAERAGISLVSRCSTRLRVQQEYL